MQLGIIGLGRMGSNIAGRLLKAGHTCVVYDANPAPGEELAKAGAIAVPSLQDLVAALDHPAAVWSMLPAGTITETTVAQLADLLTRGDCIIDGGNTYYKDDIRRAKTLAAKSMSCSAKIMISPDRPMFIWPSIASTNKTRTTLVPWNIPSIKGPLGCLPCTCSMTAQRTATAPTW